MEIIQALLQLTGDPSGAQGAITAVKRDAEALGANMVRVTNQIYSNAEAKAAQIADRIARLNMEHPGLVSNVGNAQTAVEAADRAALEARTRMERVNRTIAVSEAELARVRNGTARQETEDQRLVAEAMLRKTQVQREAEAASRNAMSAQTAANAGSRTEISLLKEWEANERLLVRANEAWEKTEERLDSLISRKKTKTQLYRDARARLNDLEKEIDTRAQTSIRLDENRIAFESKLTALQNASIEADKKKEAALKQLIAAQLELDRAQANQKNNTTAGASATDRAEIDLRNARLSLKTVTAEAAAAEKNLRESRSVLDTATRELDKNERALVTQTEKAEALQTHYTTASYKLSAGLHRVGTAAREAATETRNAGDRAVHASGGYAQFHEKIGGLMVRLNGMQMGLAMVGQTMMMIGSQGDNWLKGAIESTAQFDQQLVGTTDIITKVPEQAQAVSDKVRNMALDVGRMTLFTASQGLTVIDTLVRSGVGIDTVIGDVKTHADGAALAVTNLATATGSELAPAVDTVVNGLNVFADQQLKVGTIVDWAGKTVNSAKMSLMDYNRAIKVAGPVADILGINYHDVDKSIAMLGRAGIVGPTAGTALKYFWQNAVPKSGVALQAMEQYGLATFNTTKAVAMLHEGHIKFNAGMDGTLQGLYQLSGGHGKLADATSKSQSVFDKFLLTHHLVASAFFDDAGKFKGTAEEIKLLGKALEGKGIDEQLTVLRNIFGLKAGSTSAAIFLGQINQAMRESARTGQPLPDVFDKITGAMEKQKGAAEIAADKMKTLSGATHYLQGSFSALMNEIAEPMQAPLIKGVQMLGALVNDLEQKVASNKGLRDFVGLAAMAGVALVQVIGVFMLMAAAATYLGPVLVGAVAAFLPMVGIITVMGASVLAFKMLLDDPNSGLLGALDKLSTAFQSVLPVRMNTFSDFYHRTIEPVATVFAGLIMTYLIPALFGLADMLKNGLPDAFSGIGNFITGTVLPVIVQFAAWFSTFLPVAMTAVKSVWENVLQPVFNGIVSILVDWVIPAVESLATWVAEMLPQASAVFKQAWDTVLMPVFNTIRLIVTTYVIPALQGIVTVLLRDMPPVIRAVAGLWRNVLAPALTEGARIFRDVLAPAIEKSIDYLSHNIPVLALLLTTLLVPAILTTTTRLIAMVTAIDPIILVLYALIGVSALFSMAYENNFLHVRDITDTVTGAIGGALHGLLELIGVVGSAIGTDLNRIGDDLGKVGDTLGKVFDGFSGKARDDAKAAGTAYVGEYQAQLDKLKPITVATLDNNRRALHDGELVAGQIGERTGDAYVSGLGIKYNDVGKTAAEAALSYGYTLGHGVEPAGKAGRDTANAYVGELINAKPPAGKARTDTVNAYIALLRSPSDAVQPAGKAGRDTSGAYVGELIKAIQPASKAGTDTERAYVASIAMGVQPAGKAGTDTANAYVGSLGVASQPAGKIGSDTRKAYRDEANIELQRNASQVQTNVAQYTKLLHDGVANAGREGELTGKAYVDRWTASWNTTNITGAMRQFDKPLANNVDRVHQLAVDAGSALRQGWLDALNKSEADTNTYVLTIDETLQKQKLDAQNRSGEMGAMMKDALNAQLGQSTEYTKLWATTTLGQFTEMAPKTAEDMKAIGGAIKDGLKIYFDLSNQDTVQWSDHTLGQMFLLHHSAGDEAGAAGYAVQQALAAQLGVGLDKVSNWKNMTIDQIAALAIPASEAGGVAGKRSAERLLAGLGLSLPKTGDWRNMTLATIQSLITPAGIAGYNAGKSSVTNVAAGMSDRMGLVVAKVRFLRQQLGIALAIEDQLNIARDKNLAVNSGQEISNERNSIRRQSQVNWAIRNQAAQQSWENQGNSGPVSTPTGSPTDGSSSTDGSPPTGDTPPYSGPPQTPYSGNGANPYGPDPSGGKTPKSAKDRTVSAAQRAATLIKDTAQAIKEGIIAFQMLAGLQVPSNVEAKAAEFADRAGKVAFQMQRVAERFRSKDDSVLNNVTKFAERALKSMELIVKGVEAFDKLSDFKAPLLSQVTSFANATFDVVRAFRAVSRNFTLDGLAFTTEFATAATQVVDLISKGVDAFAKLTDFVAPTQASVKALVDSVQSTMLYLAPLAHQWRPQALSDSSAYADAASKVMDNLGKAVDFFDKLNTMQANTRALVGRAGQLRTNSNEILHFVSTLAEGWDKGKALELDSYSISVGKAVDGLAKSVDFFQKLSDSSFTLTGARRRAKAIEIAIRDIMSDVSSVWGTISTAAAKSEENYGGAAVKVMEALNKTVEMLTKLSSSDYTMTGAKEKITSLIGSIKSVMDEVQSAWPSLDNVAAKSTDTYGTAAQKVTDALLKSVAFFDKLSLSKTSYKDFAGRVTEIVNATRQAMGAFVPIASGWNDFGGVTAKFAEATLKVVDSLLKSVEFFDKLKLSKTSYKDFADRVKEIASASAAAAHAMASVTPSDFDSASVTKFSDRTIKVIDALDKTLTLIDNLAKSHKEVTPEQIQALVAHLGEAIAAYQVEMGKLGITLTSTAGESRTIQSTIADSQVKIFAALTSAFDLLTKLRAYEAPTTVKPSEVFGRLLAFLADTLSQFSALKDRFAELANADTVALADSVGKTVTGIGAALDFFIKLQTFEGVSSGRISNFISSLKLTVQMLRDGLLNEVTPSMLEAAQAFGAGLTPAVDLMMKALGLFVGLMGADSTSTTSKGTTSTDKGGLAWTDPARILNFINALKFLIEKLRDGLLNVIAPEMLSLAQAFGTKIGPAIDVLVKTLGLFITMQGDGKNGGFKPIDPNRIGALVGGLYTLLHHWNNLIIGGEFQGDFKERSAIFAQTVGTVLEQMTKVVDLAVAITTAEGKAGSISKLPEMMQTIVTSLRIALGVVLPETAAASGRTMDRIANTTSTKLSTTGQTFKTFFGQVRDMFSLESQYKTQGTLTWHWAAGILGVMVDRLEGKNGAHVQIRVGIENMLNQVSDILAGAGEVIKPWSDRMHLMLSTTQSAVAGVRRALASLNGMSVTISVTTSGLPPGSGGPPPSNSAPQGGGGGGGPTANATSRSTTHFNISSLHVNATTDLPAYNRRQLAIAMDPS